MLAAAAAIAVFLTIDSSGVAPGVENAGAAVRKASTLTAASAAQSGTVTVHMTHDGQPWAHKAVRWNGEDVEVVDGSPGRPGKGVRQLRVVGGTLYAPADDGSGWIDFGSPASIDPDSGTTPAEHLAAARDDVAGTTLRRLVGAMSARDLTTTELGDGSTVYRGTVEAGRVARETGFKDGELIRVFPFGYAANGEAADPTATLATTVTVASDGVIRQIALTWGTWSYAVTYRDLGSTPAPAAPANATSLRDLRRVPAQP